MQEVFDFIMSHSQLISVALHVIFIVILFFKKRPLNGIAANLYLWCIEAVIYAENEYQGEGDFKPSSSQKLATALREVRRKFESYYGYNFSSYSKIAESYIESILKTPQKKG